MIFHRLALSLILFSNSIALFSKVYWSYDSIAALIPSHSSLNGYDTHGYTPLLWAIENGDTSMTKRLLKKGACPNLPLRTEKKWTPLMLATHYQQYEMVYELLLYRAQPNTQDEAGWIALHMAVKKMNLPLLELFLKHKSEINTRNYRGDTPLHSAVINNWQEGVITLLAAGACKNMTNAAGQTALSLAHSLCHRSIERILCAYPSQCSVPFVKIEFRKAPPCNPVEDLFNAIEWNQPEEIEFLLQHNPNRSLLSSSNFWGNTPLTYATKKNRTDICRILLAYGAPINRRDRDNKSALLYAIEEKNYNTVLLLLEHGGQVNEMYHDGRISPLKHAIERKALDIFKLLLNHGADVQKNNIIHDATKEGKSDYLELLLRHGAPINRGDSHRQTPLMVAASYGYRNCVELLLNHGADIHQKDWNGKNALAYALENHHTSLINLFLKAGANLPINSEKELTSYLNDAIISNHDELSHKLLEASVDIDEGKPLLTAIKYNRTKIIEELITCGANVHLSDSDHNNVIHYAIEQNNIPLVCFFIHAGVSVNTKNKRGITPLIKALRKNNEKLAIILIKAQANVKDGAPLCVAIQTREYEIAKIILKNGGNLNEQDYDGNNPLIYAVQAQNIPFVLFLLEQNCLTNVKNKDNLSALDYAVELRQTELTSLLLRNGADGYHSLIHTIYKSDQTGVELLLERSRTIQMKPLTNQTDDLDRTPVMHALISIQKNRRKSLSIFVSLKQGLSALFNKKRKSPKTHLILKKLLDHDADIRRIDKHGDNALMYAISMGDDLAVEMILEHNPLLEIRNQEGETPLAKAYKTKNKTIIKLLKKEIKRTA